ncbi:HlyD family efflux transporter periplasmic adaptor subunit [Desulforhopalus sp. 52FAK]
MDSLVQYWLSTLTKSVEGVARAVVVKIAADSADSVVARLPDSLTDIEELQKIIETVSIKTKTVFYHNVSYKNSDGEPQDIIASPLFVDKVLFGVVVLQISTRVTGRQKVAVQQTENASTWFEILYKQRSLNEKDQLVTVVELVAACLEHENFQAAATSALTLFTSSFKCDRISLGLCKGTDVVVEAISHTGVFDRRSNLIGMTRDAMVEAVEQNQTIRTPAEATSVYYSRCHDLLMDQQSIGHICSVPFVVDGKIAGTFLAEGASSQKFDATQVEQFEQIASLIGPLLYVRKQNEQRLLTRITSGIKEWSQRFVGPGHFGLKLTAVVLVVAALIVSIVQTDYRVTGKARLEAKNQRVIVAPQDGFVAESKVRPGDIVQAGELIAALDIKDLTLELQKWTSQFEQLRREYREALAQHERSAVNILHARIKQAEAQINLVQEQIVRSRFNAPFDGIVVSGDLSQALGVPVERGQVLFTVAPLIAYRVVLMVDERDIGSVQKAQQGKLVLSSMPSKPLPFTVDSITPVSSFEDGRNFFKVEAKLTESSDLLRPGMEGVGKIVIEPRRLIWIWSHKIVDWLRLAFWSIQP